MTDKVKKICDEKRSARVPWLAMAYWSWVGISILATCLSAYTGEYWDLMSQAVTLAGEIEEEIDHDQMVWGFIIISILFFVINVIIGMLLVWRTNKGNGWAKYLLTLFSAYQIYFAVDTMNAIRLNYTFEYGADDWIFGVITLLLLIFIGVRPYLRRN